MTDPLDDMWGAVAAAVPIEAVVKAVRSGDPEWNVSTLVSVGARAAVEYLTGPQTGPAAEPVERVSSYLAEIDRRAAQRAHENDLIHGLGFGDEGPRLLASDLRALLAEHERLRQVNASLRYTLRGRKHHHANDVARLAAELEEARAAVPAENYPCQLGVSCDQCGAEWAGDFVVNDSVTKADRLALVRKEVVTNHGWACGENDLCPKCNEVRYQLAGRIWLSAPLSRGLSGDEVRAIADTVIAAGWRPPAPDSEQRCDGTCDPEHFDNRSTDDGKPGEWL